MKTILLMVILLLLSCKKERQIFISATNPATGAGYANLPFKIVETKTGAFEEKFDVFYEGTLDANGEASVALKFKNNRGYEFRCNPPENTCYNKPIQSTFGDLTNPKTEFNFEFAPCANLKLEIENINCSGPSDSVRLKRFYNYAEPNGWTPYFTGCYQFVSDEYVSVSSGWMFYTWEVIRNGNLSTFTDSSYLDAGEFVDFKVEY